MPARILVEVELDFHDKTLAQIEAELMEQVRTALGPAFQQELAARGGRPDPWRLTFRQMS